LTAELGCAGWGLSEAGWLQVAAFGQQAWQKGSGVVPLMAAQEALPSKVGGSTGPGRKPWPCAGGGLLCCWGEGCGGGARPLRRGALGPRASLRMTLEDSAGGLYLGLRL
jgi:hypothetical protein